jgi:ribonuclease HII
MPDLSLEKRLLGQGYKLVAGVDEAGRGPLAGPVVAAAVVLPPCLTGLEPWLDLLDDSKALTPAQRDRAYAAVRRHGLAVGVGHAAPEEIDHLGIGQAVISAMLRAVADLPLTPAHLLLDFVHLKECALPFQSVVRGDSISYSIAAASNVAKVTRDRWMREADRQYPGYSFAQNKGYPTAQHRAVLKQLGPCRIHRRSFAPVREAAELWGLG